MKWMLWCHMPFLKEGSKFVIDMLVGHGLIGPCEAKLLLKQKGKNYRAFLELYSGVDLDTFSLNALFQTFWRMSILLQEDIKHLNPSSVSDICVTFTKLLFFSLKLLRWWVRRAYNTYRFTVRCEWHNYS